MRKDVVFSITPLDLSFAEERTYRAFNVFADAIQSKQRPEDPPQPWEDRVSWWRSRPDSLQPYAWVAWDGDRIVGMAYLLLPLETNKHLGHMHASVLPTYRRRGIGKSLLRSIAETAQGAGRQLLLTHTNSRVPAGEQTLRQLGATEGQVSEVNQLELRVLDEDLLQRWVQQGQEHNPDFEVGFWLNDYPQERLVEIAGLLQVMNTAPRGNLELEDETYTPEQLRQMEASLSASGWQRLTAYVAERGTGRLAGFTEVGWKVSTPGILHQWSTGVWPQERGRGLGRWLKAAMLLRVRSELVEARLVRSENATDNGPMLRINHQLGFVPFMREVMWQVPLSQVWSFLGRRREM